MSSDSVHAIWVDPLAFNALENGPPYLPETPVLRTASKAPVSLGDLLDDSPMAELGALLAMLQAASHVHQSHHWRTTGSEFYGDHLMFMRVYEESQDLIDQLAERAVGSGSAGLVRPDLQINLMSRLIQGWLMVEADYASLSLIVEQAVVEGITEAKNALEAKGQLSDGTDNLLQGIADKHEEFVYLLQQRAVKREASYSYDHRCKTR